MGIVDNEHNGFEHKYGPLIWTLRGTKCCPYELIPHGLIAAGLSDGPGFHTSASTTCSCTCACRLTFRSQWFLFRSCRTWCGWSCGVHGVEKALRVAQNMLKRASLLIWFLSDLGLDLEREGLGQRRRKLREEEEEKEVKRGSDTAGDRLWRRRTVRKEIM